MIDLDFLENHFNDIFETIGNDPFNGNPPGLSFADGEAAYYYYRDSQQLNTMPVAPMNLQSLISQVSNLNQGSTNTMVENEANQAIDCGCGGEIEKICGPDVTKWLIDEMNANKDHPAIKTNRENSWAMWIPFFNLGWHAAFLNDFKDLVKAGGVWDYKSSETFTSANCPVDCKDTVTLCGHCFFYDVPGNINYGWVGRAGRIRAWFLHNRAAAAQAGGVDDPKDTAAINIGIDLWDGTGKNLCVKVNASLAKLATRNCPTCGEKHT
ncbi:MAG TPA: hypothetical protein ENJ82_05180 [Bacteroidetes bacterium]|nr:hypothetical protein [Bacteroidota bacterium]